METNANQKVSCVANYAYEASESDELTIRPGDVLRDVERLPGGWWRGELRGRRGMFPDNFVSVLPESTGSRSGGVQGRCRAVFSYQPANPDELPLCVGDVLEVLGEVEEGWWQGRRQGRVGVFPSNFVVMLDPPQATSPYEPAPALPPKPVKEICRVIFPYTAVNEDELSLAEGDVVTVLSKEAPDRGWWRGELRGRQGLFPDNFVQLLPPVTTIVDEKKPDRPASKTAAPSIYPVLNKYSEKTASIKELTTSKISLHKENTVSKELSSQTTVTSTNKSESEKLIHTETVPDGTLDGQVKKPPVPLKKSPTPSGGVGALFSGFKNKMLSSDKEKSTTTSIMNNGECDKPDGGGVSKPATTATTDNHTASFDHVERTTLLTDPRAGRVKAPRRRPPSQAFRDDTPAPLASATSAPPVPATPAPLASATPAPLAHNHTPLSNGHEVPTTTNTLEKDKEKTAAEKAADEIKPRTREWEKHKAPWMEELKLNQAKKTSFGESKARSTSSGSEGGVASKPGGGSTDRILEVGLEEKRSTHSMEMSKSTSSISSRMSVLESYEESKVRHSADAKSVTVTQESKPTLSSPTAAGRTFTSMLDEIKKPAAPSPPLASARTSDNMDKSNKTDHRVETKTDVKQETNTGTVFERTSTLERIHKNESEKISEKVNDKSSSSTVDRLMQSFKADRNEGMDALITQLNNRISNLEKLLEVQNTMFKSAIEDLTEKLKHESDKRQALQSEVEKLAHCVTQV